MEIGPIWRSAWRSKTGIVLVVLQIACTMALVVNAIAITHERTGRMGQPSGVDEANIFHLVSSTFDPDVDPRLMIDEDLRRLRAMPGVEEAISTNQVPLWGGGWSMSLKTEVGAEIEDINMAVYMVDEHAVDAFGLELVAGEMFTAADVRWMDEIPSGWSDKIVLTRALAEALFPDDPGYGVGKTVYIADTEPMTVLGVVEKLQAPWTGWTEVIERSALLPQRQAGPRTPYLVRAEPGARDSLMPQVEDMLAERERGRILENLRTMEETRERGYNDDQAIVNILTFTVVVLIAITGLGIAGLTSFNVTRRTKQIGTRRALGASRLDILRYFMLENLLFTGLGVVLGAIVAVGVNLWVVEAFEMPRFEWWLVPAAMVTLLAIGQLAVLAPARRAARVAPAVATRTI